MIGIASIFGTRLDRAFYNQKSLCQELGDIVLVDMNKEYVVADENTWTTVGWSPFIGKTLVGWPVLTVVDGIPVFERNEETGPKGRCLVEPVAVGKPLVMTPWK